MEIQRHRAAIRIALLYLAITAGVLAIWILVAPRSFYDNFPAGSVHWVDALPPYNEHLERDFGAASLGLALLAGLAAYWMDRRVIQAAAATWIAAGLPHLIYHLTTTERYSTADNIASMIGLTLEVALPLGILYLVSDGAQRAPAPPAKAEGVRP
ncbi:MAG TPA: hypothetical protein VLB79_06840 [Solirubrobacterales bacterium]|nr:hypothetical protein [Solirubrobacterales bacterium]